jgi:Flp pilus assembly pilin Flp
MRIASLNAAIAARLHGLRRFADESGASLMEYAIVLGIISAVSVFGLSLLGTNARAMLSSAAASLGS